MIGFPINRYEESTMKMTFMAVSLMGILSSVQAADIDAGKEKVAACAGCHGADGMATQPAYPNLAGQNAEYLVSAMKAYQSGDRNHAIMKAMVASLSETDIENIAAYYESLK